MRPDVPPRPDPTPPVEPRPLGTLFGVTLVTNGVLALSTLLGWLGRPSSCPTSCPWRPYGGFAWVVLVVIDVGLALVWAGVGYMRLVGVGERIGRRISQRRDAHRDQDRK